MRYLPWRTISSSHHGALSTNASRQQHTVGEIHPAIVLARRRRTNAQLCRGAAQAIIPTWLFSGIDLCRSLCFVRYVPCAPLWAFKDFVMPQAENATTYPSKDAHPNEKITVAVDLYNTAPKDDIFNTHYVQEGILPVFLVITNDGDKPISVTKMQAELVTANRSKLEALGVPTT